MDLPARKPIRLKNYDYSSPGAYFITICTRDKRCILSSIETTSGNAVGEGLAPPAPRLSAAGRIVEEQILSLPVRFPGLSIDSYVVMPNHIHLLLTIKYEMGGASPSPTVKTNVIDAVRALKSFSSRLSGVGPIWQRSFYGHIIRNDDDCRQIAEYIAANPARWKTGPPPPGADQGGPVFPQPRHWRAESEAGPPMASAARWTEDRFYPET